MHYKKLLSILAFLLILIPTWAFAKNIENLGENLERNFFKAVAEKDWNTVESSIGPGFQSIHAREIRDKQTVIPYIKSLDLKRYRFSDFKVTSNPQGTILVVTYTLNYAEQVGIHPRTGQGTKNLSVWEKIDGKWQWIAHAVID